MIKATIIKDIKSTYSELDLSEVDNITRLIEKTNDKFIFIFDEYFGFTQKEVKDLCTQNKNMTYEELEYWYNGYMTATGLKVYYTIFTTQKYQYLNIMMKIVYLVFVTTQKLKNIVGK